MIMIKNNINRKITCPHLLFPFICCICYLEKNTDKYKFYCSVTSSYMNANNNICDFSCNNIGYVIVESTETSYSKYYIPVPIICEPK